MLEEDARVLGTRASAPTCNLTRFSNCDSIAGSIDDTYSAGPSTRPTCTRCYFAVTNMIQMNRVRLATCWRRTRASLGRFCSPKKFASATCQSKFKFLPKSLTKVIFPQKSTKVNCHPKVNSDASVPPKKSASATCQSK